MLCSIPRRIHNCIMYR